MAWNESGNGKNPWDRNRNDGPPDLDKIVRQWQQRLAGIFRGGRGPRGPAPAGQGPSGPVAGAVLGLVVLGWAATGFYQVDDAERGVVLRFGRYVSSSEPGLGWHLPWPIERVEVVNTGEVVPFSQQTPMLTADENIVVVDVVVQYRRADPVKYLFNVRDPEGTLRDVAESAIREVVGKSKLDFVLTEGRAEIAANTEKLIQKTLDEYGAGMQVTQVNLQKANFPSEVDTAVQDAIKAREDKERVSFEAQAYANDIVPRARGESVRRREDAAAYQARVVADAQGEASRFSQLMAEYRKAPEVTRRRLYLETLEQVYGRSSKVLVDAKGSGNMIYLPVDKLLEQQRSAPGPTASPRPGVVAEPQAGEPSRARDDRRSREVR